MPIKLAYRLSKLASAVEIEINFYRSKVQELIDKYGVKDEKGQPVLTEQGGIQIQKEFQAECQKALNELDSLEIELKFEPFSIEDFDNFDISPEDFQGILPFLAD